jgi:hypothetical protein
MQNSSVMGNLLPRPTLLKTAEKNTERSSIDPPARVFQLVAYFAVCCWLFGPLFVAQLCGIPKGIGHKNPLPTTRNYSAKLQNFIKTPLTQVFPSDTPLRAGLIRLKHSLGKDWQRMGSDPHRQTVT